MHAVERDRVDVLQEIGRVDRVVLHQAGKSGPMFVEMRLLDTLGFGCVAVEQALDVCAHALIDQREQARRSRVKAIVEVENPVADVGEASVHSGIAPNAFCIFMKLKGFLNHRFRSKPLYISGLSGGFNERTAPGKHRLRDRACLQVATSATAAGGGGC